MQATILDDIVGVQPVQNADLIKMTLVSGGQPLDVLVPVEAAAKLWLRLLDVFRRDGRSLQERRNLVQEEFEMTVSRLQVHDILVEAPQSSAEQYGLTLLLDDGLTVNTCLPESLVERLEDQSRRAVDRHRSTNPPKPS